MGVLTSDQARELARRIAYGGEEDGARVVEGLVNGVAQQVHRQTQANLPAVVHVAKEHATAAMRLEMNVERLGQEFPALFSDRGLTIVAVDEVGNLRQKYGALGIPKSDLEIYREACQNVSERYGGPPSPMPQAPQAAAATVPGRSLREAPSYSNRPASAQTYMAPARERYTETSLPMEHDPGLTDDPVELSRRAAAGDVVARMQRQRRGLVDD